MEQHLTTSVVKHQIKLHQMVKGLRYEIKTLRNENKQIKESLHFVNSALIQLFLSPSEDTVSRCGTAIVRFTVSNGKVSYKTIKNFFAHSNGYKARFQIWPKDVICMLHLLLSVVPATAN